MTIGWSGAVGLSSLLGSCTVGGDGEDDAAKAGDEEFDEDTDETRWITEQRTTAGSGVSASSAVFCVKLMSCGSVGMIDGSRTTIASSIDAFGDSHELVMVGGVGGYSLRWAWVRINLCEPLP